MRRIQTQEKLPQDYAKRLSEIRSEASPYLEKLDSCDFDWRDVAILMEYLQQIGDVLDEMIENPPAIVPVTSADDVKEGLDLWLK